MAQRKKGREARAEKPPEDDGSSLMAVKLEEKDLKERGAEIVDWLVKKESLDAKKKAQVKKINEEIKLASQRISVLTRELDTGEAMIERQTAIDFGSIPARGGRRNGAAVEAAELASANDTASEVS